MQSFEKSDVREQITTERVFELLQDWGGEPEYANFGIVATTICHNYPGEGSRKLYYYENTSLFRCYTGCDAAFDIFELAIKVQLIQNKKEFDLNDAVLFIARRFAIAGSEVESEDGALEDWKILLNYDRIDSLAFQNNFQQVLLKEYDSNILSHFLSIPSYDWLKEGISKEVMLKCGIGYYPGGEQITIPHFDANGRFIGLRGRNLGKEESELYGKYRPLKVNQGLYNHPLGFNLYNLNNSKNDINTIQKAIIFEGKRQSRPSLLFLLDREGLRNWENFSNSQLTGKPGATVGKIDVW